MDQPEAGSGAEPHSIGGASENVLIWSDRMLVCRDLNLMKTKAEFAGLDAFVPVCRAVWRATIYVTIMCFRSPSSVLVVWNQPTHAYYACAKSQKRESGTITSM
jgi:hypothetical protein